jgi:hypothetical protein
MLHTNIHLRIVLKSCVAIATIILIGFSHPKASYFLLLRLGNCSRRCSNSCIPAVEKKVAKEKATRMPLASCALSFLPGFAKRDRKSLLAKRGIHAAPLRAIPDKNASARRGIRELIVTLVI